MSLSARLQKSWYRADGKDWLSLALLDAGWIYQGLVALRKKLYVSGVMHSTRLRVPVVVVGNCVVGGAGKTPIVIELAKLLASQGYCPGIISRGYGRQGEQVLEVLPNTPASESGDEPALIKSAQSAPVFVASDRVEAAQALLAAYPQTNVILSDDGLQHLALQRDMEICVFDERGAGNGRLLPAGPLREPWPRDCDFVLHRGGMEEGFVVERSLATVALHADGRKIALAELSDLSQNKLIALAGIAQPEAFFSMLREQGLTLSDTLALPDHYDFNSIPRSINKGQWLICTEKDAVKLWPSPLAQSCQIVAVPLVVTLPPAFCSALLEKLSSLQTQH